MPIDNQHQLLDDIDARQNEVLDQLDALNRQIERTIEGVVTDRTDQPGSVDKKDKISADDPQSHSTDSDSGRDAGRKAA